MAVECAVPREGKGSVMHVRGRVQGAAGVEGLREVKRIQGQVRGRSWTVMDEIQAKKTRRNHKYGSRVV